MGRQKLTMALSLYDRHLPFFDGTVGIRDIDLEVLAVGESDSLRNGLNRHYRMLAEREFDACEVSLSSYIMAKGQGLPFTAIPVFPRRLFSQSHIWVNADGSIRAPKDLIGRKVGLITFQTTLSWDSVFLLEITFRLNGTMFNIRPNFFPFEIFLGVRPSGRVNLMGSSDATHHSISRHRRLLRAKDSISFELAERRSIRLISPYSPSKSTSRTLQFSFSIVNPGEVARAHRHNMAAIRFVVQGHGACTVVEGERFLMEEGDLILTPNWTWHDHFNASGEPIIWLDGLGGPLIYTLNALFFEEYEKEAQTVVRADGDSTRHLGLAPASQRLNSEPVGMPFRYPSGDTYAALQAINGSEADPYDGSLVQFVNPRSGGPTLATMFCAMQLLKPGQRTRSHRHTSSTLYHVFRGRGRTAVGEGFLQWQKGDSFVIPLWLWHHHENQSGNEALLFSITDRPLMEATGLYRAEA